AGHDFNSPSPDTQPTFAFTSIGAESMLNAWIGARYAECGRAVLLLQSTWGAVVSPQREDVRWFIEGGRDATFGRLHRTCAGRGESRLDFFNRFACMNLYEPPVGPANESKVTDEQLRAGAATLFARLTKLRPRTVWIASKRAAPFAVAVIKEYGARLV